MLFCYLKDTFCQRFFNPINLIIAYSLNENEPQLLATSENVGCEVAKQFLICLVVFESEPLANQLLIQKKRVRNLLKAIFALTMVHWRLLDNDIYSVFAVYTYIFLLASFISLQHICRMLVYYQSLFQVVFCIFFRQFFLNYFSRLQ